MDFFGLDLPAGSKTRPPGPLHANRLVYAYVDQCAPWIACARGNQGTYANRRATHNAELEALSAFFGPVTGSRCLRPARQRTAIIQLISSISYGGAKEKHIEAGQDRIESTLFALLDRAQPETVTTLGSHRPPLARRLAPTCLPPSNSTRLTSIRTPAGPVPPACTRAV